MENGKSFTCLHCDKNFAKRASLNTHLVLKKSCHLAEKSRIKARNKRIQGEHQLRDEAAGNTVMGYNHHDGEDDGGGELVDGGGWEQDWVGQGLLTEPETPNRSPELSPKPASPLFVREFDPPAGQALGFGPSPHESQLRREQVLGWSKYGPFVSRANWDLANWLLTEGVKKGARDRYFKWIGRTNPAIKWSNDSQFLKDVDKLPRGPKWKCEIITMRGDNDGRLATEHLEFWRRDVLECIRDLLSNPAFRNAISYAPIQCFTDPERTVRVYDEMWTADWWWNQQNEINPGDTLVPIILASDKTQLSVFSGDKQAWPVYLSIGNISKEMRRLYSQQAMIPIAYIPVSKFRCFKIKARRQIESWKFFHSCMKKILNQIIETGDRAVNMLCSDTKIRSCRLAVASYIADWPEQCLIACCRENRCVRCRVARMDRGEWVESADRRPEETLRAIKNVYQKKPGSKECAHQMGLRYIWPFWAHLPRSNIHLWFKPDLLHQIHKGVFKDHIFDWCVDLVGKEELDARFRAMTPYPGLKSFNKGISHLQQWTGIESKAIERVFVAILCGLPGEMKKEVLLAARAFVDLVFFAGLHRHTTDTIDGLKDALNRFHEQKEIFLILGVAKTFNFAKMHALIHYVQAILESGSLDGYNTEYPERLHIDYTKVSYRASNKVTSQYLKQMAKWLERHDAFHRRAAYITWRTDVGHNTPDTNARDDFDGSSVSESGSDPSVDSDDSGFSNSSTASLPIVQRTAHEARPSRDSFRMREPQSRRVRLDYRTYWTAKRPSLPARTVSQMEEIFGVIDFLTPLNEYLSKTPSAPVLTVRLNHRFDCWTQFRIYHPQCYEIGEQGAKESVRALPAKHSRDPRHNRTTGVFDTVLLLVDQSAQGIHKYQVAQVRAIFQLTSESFRGNRDTERLVYVELFTKFTKQADTISGLYTVSRLSDRQNRPITRVVQMEKIHFACHLAPAFRKAVDVTWTAAEVLEQCPEFYVNTDCSRRLWILAQNLDISV